MIIQDCNTNRMYEEVATQYHAYLEDALTRPKTFDGYYCRLVEEELCKAFNVENAALTTSGSLALSQIALAKGLKAGDEKVILGSGAIKNKEFLKEACEKFKNQIALGLDAKDGNLSVSGWKETLNVKTLDFLKEVTNYGISRIIYTDINRDGMKTSPNFDETIKIAELSNCPVVISGGVSSINDIKKAKELNNVKIEGIIVGKAIYDGDIKLDELAEEISA